MAYRSGSDIRETFQRFFESKGHRRVHSSSLVPANDSTLLFTNAGMNQFKDVFLGLEQRDYARAVSSQKCVRAGGKHNDLENVGFTRRHHTFFEMLGNFSFGDYFKRDAIAYAWELLTSPDWLGIPKDRLYITIFQGEQGVPRDQEAYDLWLSLGIPPERIFAFGMQDNFWAMGDTGPCGPCSEIFHDMGIEASESGEDLPFGEDSSRYVEIWNLVFMQFDRDLHGELNLLAKPSIDTGAGLERLAALLQGKLSNFETDLFMPLIDAALALVARASGRRELREANDRVMAASFNVIADHARSAVFLIADGVIPANDGRGYVLRKIIRRAIRHGRLQGATEPFFFEMAGPVVDLMGDAYPELIGARKRVEEVLIAEEDRFLRTIEVGSLKLEELIDAAIDQAASQFRDAPEDSTTLRSSRLAFLKARGNNVTLPGGRAFHLYETYGLPLDFIMDAARDQGLEFDLTGFETARAEEQARARASWKGGSKASANPAFRDLPKTRFEGYRQLISRSCEVLAIVKDGAGVPSANAGESVDIVLDHSSFYADSGGQTGDKGWFYSDDHNTVVADILGCVQPVQGVRSHKARLRQPISIGGKVDSVVDPEYRSATRRNHTGTHLLHAALREVLGKHVKQAGSLVDPNRLRFDFSHFTSVADEELQDIEDLINRQVFTNTKVETIEDVPLDVAVNEYHAMALFGEKYGEKVRVVKIGDFSVELCGGTHTGATGEIGLVKLLSENSVSSGVRRVEAVTGFGALAEFRRGQQVVQVAGQLAGAANPHLSAADSLRHKLSQQDEELKKLRRELEQTRMKSAASSAGSAASEAIEVDGVKVLAQRVDALERGQMRTLVDTLRSKLGSGVVVLGASQEDGKVSLVVGVTKDLTARLPAGKIIAPLAQQVGGSGGGRPDMAEAGGKDTSALNAALASAPEVIRALLGSGVVLA